MKKKTDKLTLKELAFVAEYMLDLNGAAAARRAGYAKDRARFTARDLLATPRVRAAVRKAFAKRIHATDVTADRVFQELVHIALADKSQVFTIRDGDVYVTDTDLLPESVRRCISAVSQTPHGIQLKFDDRVKALELLGRRFAMFSDNVNLQDNRKPIEDMTEAELDEELTRLSVQKAAGPATEAEGTDQPA